MSDKKETKLALGRSKRRQGEETRNRILNFLREQRLTHGELKKKAKLSAAALSPHIKKLMSQNLIQKRFLEGKGVVYEVAAGTRPVKVYIDFVINNIEWSYGASLYPDIEQRVRDALIDDMKRKGFLKKEE